MMKNGASKTHSPSGEVLGTDLEVGLTVEVPADARLVPVDGEGVEVVGDVDRLPVPARPSSGSGIPRPVDGPDHEVGLTSDVLHDVDLADVGPAVCHVVGVLVEARAEHPERRPRADSLRHLDARFDPAVLELAQPLGLEPSRRVERVLVLLLAEFDHEHAVVGARVLAPIGVELRLPVPPPPAADVVGPVRGVDRLAVELVAPHQLHADRWIRRNRLGRLDRIPIVRRPAGRQTGRESRCEEQPSPGSIARSHGRSPLVTPSRPRMSTRR